MRNIRELPELFQRTGAGWLASLGKSARALTAMGVMGGIMLGCGPRVAPPGDTEAVRQVVAEVSEARTRPEILKTLFVEGKVPDKKWLSGLTKKSLVVDQIDVTGEKAVVQLHFETFQGEKVGATSWQCVRQGDHWQIDEAPLPPGN